MSKINCEEMINDILNLGADFAKEFNPQNLIFSNKFRKYCEENKCGHYGTNWMCPPAVGPIENCKEEIIQFHKGIVFQTLGKIKNMDDRKGMMRARDKNNELLREISEFIRKNYEINKFLPMGAGHCEICERCAYLDGKKCRHPEKAVCSAEAYGIDLGELLKSSGLKFNYSQDTIAYVSLILWK